MSKTDPIERDFLEALQRLVDGKPQDKLNKVSAKAGKLKINAVSVAREAGRSRTLIALENCRYPKVREAIKLVQGEKKAFPTTYTQLIENLRADLARVKAEKRILEITMASHVLARRKAEVNARRDASEASKLRKLVVEYEKIVHLPQIEKEPPRLVLIRGLQGSGKSTKARGYQADGYVHFEADQFFESDDGYVFDKEKLPQAHAWCLEQTRHALNAGEFVVVANVFATEFDIQPYVDLGFSYEIIEATHRSKSIHEVPDAVINRTNALWVPTSDLIKAIKIKLGKVPKAKVSSIRSVGPDKK